MDQLDNKSFIGAFIMFLVIVLITIALFIVEVPAANQKVVGLLIGMFATNLGSVIFRILGRDPDDLKSKELKIAELQSQNEYQKKRIDHLDQMFTQLQSQIITKISVLSEKK